MKQTILITGANRGIGLELTKRYLEEGHKVFALCRKTSPELKGLSAEVIEGCDVANLSSLQKIAREIAGVQFDLLICNAGVLNDEQIMKLEEADFESMLYQFNVNSLGPLRTFSTFRRHLTNGAKVAMITSRMGSISDNTSGGHYGYRMSKTALNMATRSLVKDFANDGILFGLFHPGWVQTEMTGHTGQLTAEESSRLLTKRISDLTSDNSGGFWHCNGEELQW